MSVLGTHQQYIHSAGRSSSHVEAIGTCNVELSSDFILQLEMTFYVPSFSRNLISVSDLVPFRISCNFSDTGFKFLIKSEVIGSGTLCNGLYSVHLQDNNAYNSLSLTARIKRNVMNEQSSLLWHRRLGHISIKRIKRLVNEGVLSALDFIDFETCLDCIKENQTNKSKNGATRIKHLLEIIHTNMCCPNIDDSDPKYFIAFIDDYSRYMYLYMFRSKDEVLETFKVFM